MLNFSKLFKSKYDSFKYLNIDTLNYEGIDIKVFNKTENILFNVNCICFNDLFNKCIEYKKLIKFKNKLKSEYYMLNYEVYITEYDFKKLLLKYNKQYISYYFQEDINTENSIFYQLNQSEDKKNTQSTLSISSFKDNINDDELVNDSKESFNSYDSYDDSYNLNDSYELNDESINLNNENKNLNSMVSFESSLYSDTSLHRTQEQKIELRPNFNIAMNHNIDNKMPEVQSIDIDLERMRTERLKLYYDYKLECYKAKLAFSKKSFLDRWF